MRADPPALDLRHADPPKHGWIVVDEDDVVKFQAISPPGDDQLEEEACRSWISGYMAGWRASSQS